MTEILLVLAGALPTVIIAVLTNKNVIESTRRESSHRMAVELRDKQIELLNEMSDALVRIIGVSSLIGEDILRKGEDITGNSIKLTANIDQLQKANSQVLKIYPKALLLLPSEIANSISQLVKVLGIVQDDPSRDNLALCNTPALDLLNHIRSFIGIDQLSNTLKIIYGAN